MLGIITKAKLRTVDIPMFEILLVCEFFDLKAYCNLSRKYYLFILRLSSPKFGRLRSEMVQDKARKD